MRAYSVLLRLYPASFRNEYGDELRALFARNRRAASGVPGLMAVWAGAVLDTIGNATLAHADILRQDLRYTARTLRRSPGFAATAILLVALGIGATTAAFSVTDFVLFRPLPFAEPDRLVRMMETTPGYSAMEFSAPNYRDWTAAASSYVSTGVYHGAAVTMTGGDEPRRLSGTSVSADLFPTLGVQPLIGRAFSASDDLPGAAATVMLSYRLWQTEFGGDPNIVGRSLTLDNQPYAVRGVMPREFHFPSSDSLFWTTNRFDAASYADDERTNNWLYAVGRLRPGVGVAAAQTEMTAIAARSERDHPVDNKSTGASVRLLGATVSERSRLLLVALSGAALCVLLIACANLANLLLARALGRRRELAVRTAIGAGRERLIRQSITESLLIASVGGVLGIAIATLSVPLLAQLVPSSLPIAETPTVDVRVLVFALALTALTGLSFGVGPVLGSDTRDPYKGLREGARAGAGRKEHVRSALVIVEIVASMVLLVSAGLLIRALSTVRGIDPGFTSAGVVTMRTELAAQQYSDPQRRQAFYDQVLKEVQALPGVTSAGFISFLPMTVRGGIWPITVKGAAGAEGSVLGNNNAAIRFATPGYFGAMSIPIVRGRDISDADTATGPRAAVVSQSFVKRYWPNEDPIGRRFDIGGLTDREVVGVVGDVRFRGLESANEPQVYVASQHVGPFLFYAPRTLAVRTSTDPLSQMSPVRAIVRRAAPGAPITAVQTLEDLVDGETASRAVQVRVLVAFAAIAFLLAAVGIHGLLSFVVSQRTTEIGVRMALGAQRRTILAMVMSRGAALAVAGVVPGVFLAYAAGRSMEALLAGVEPADMVTLAGAMALSVLMTILGTLSPTLRALRVNPAIAFRAE